MSKRLRGVCRLAVLTIAALPLANCQHASGKPLWDQARLSRIATQIEQGCGLDSGSALEATSAKTLLVRFLRPDEVTPANVECIMAGVRGRELDDVGVTVLLGGEESRP